MKATHFSTPAAFRHWLEANHATATELSVGFYKKASGKTGLAYAEAIEQALCFGWIDGVLRRIDDVSYALRFTPRRPGSIWSNVNIARVERLTAAGQMHPAGFAAFAARDRKKVGIYAFENAAKSLPPAYEKKFRAHKKAWAFFSAQPPGYRRLALHKIVSPKQAATRDRWLARVIAASTASQRIS